MTLVNKPGFVQLNVPAGVTHFYAQQESYGPAGSPGVYEPVNGVLTIPAALFVPNMLAQGYTIADSTPPPSPVRGWSFADLPFLTWLGNSW
jgi:hypothetical protein